MYSGILQNWSNCQLTSTQEVSSSNCWLQVATSFHLWIQLSGMQGCGDQSLLILKAIRKDLCTSTTLQCIPLMLLCRYSWQGCWDQSLLTIRKDLCISTTLQSIPLMFLQLSRMQSCQDQSLLMVKAIMCTSTTLECIPLMFHFLAHVSCHPQTLKPSNC